MYGSERIHSGYHGLLESELTSPRPVGASCRNFSAFTFVFFHHTLFSACPPNMLYFMDGQLYQKIISQQHSRLEAWTRMSSLSG